MVGAIPAWFDEGLAVIVSEDPRYLLASTESDRCRVDATGSFPIAPMEWTRAAGTDHNLYARAACRVLRWWMNANGGNAAALALVRKVAEGVPFSEIYHDPAEGETPKLGQESPGREMNFVNFRFKRDSDGIALLTLDMPGRSMNVITPEVIGEIETVVDHVAA